MADMLWWLVILSAIAVSGLTEDGCYIVSHCCFRFDRGVVHVVVVGYIVSHCCFRFDRGVVHVVVLDILSAIAVLGLTEEWFMLCQPVVLGLTEEWFMLWWLVILSALLAVLSARFDRGVVHVVVVGYQPLGQFMLWWLAILLF